MVCFFHQCVTHSLNHSHSHSSDETKRKLKVERKNKKWKTLNYNFVTTVVEFSCFRQNIKKKGNFVFRIDFLYISRKGSEQTMSISSFVSAHSHQVA